MGFDLGIVAKIPVYALMRHLLLEHTLLGLIAGDIPMGFPVGTLAGLVELETLVGLVDLAETLVGWSGLDILMCSALADTLVG